MSAPVRQLPGFIYDATTNRYYRAQNANRMTPIQQSVIERPKEDFLDKLQGQASIRRTLKGNAFENLVTKPTRESSRLPFATGPSTILNPKILYYLKGEIIPDRHPDNTGKALYIDIYEKTVSLASINMSSSQIPLDVEGEEGDLLEDFTTTSASYYNNIAIISGYCEIEKLPLIYCIETRSRGERHEISSEQIPHDDYFYRNINQDKTDPRRVLCNLGNSILTRTFSREQGFRHTSTTRHVTGNISYICMEDGSVDAYFVAGPTRGIMHVNSGSVSTEYYSKPIEKQSIIKLWSHPQGQVLYANVAGRAIYMYDTRYPKNPMPLISIMSEESNVSGSLMNFEVDCEGGAIYGLDLFKNKNLFQWDIRRPGRPMCSWNVDEDGVDRKIRSMFLSPTTPRLPCLLVNTQK